LQIPKPILLTAKLLQAISPKLVTWFAAKLFTTPLKHKIPKREWEMDSQSKKERLWIPSIRKKSRFIVMGWAPKGAIGAWLVWPRNPIG